MVYQRLTRNVIYHSGQAHRQGKWRRMAKNTYIFHWGLYRFSFDNRFSNTDGEFWN